MKYIFLNVFYWNSLWYKMNMNFSTKCFPTQKFLLNVFWMFINLNVPFLSKGTMKMNRISALAKWIITSLRKWQDKIRQCVTSRVKLSTECDAVLKFLEQIQIFYLFYGFCHFIFPIKLKAKKLLNFAQ